MESMDLIRGFGQNDGKVRFTTAFKIFRGKNMSDRTLKIINVVAWTIAAVANTAVLVINFTK